VNAVEPTLTSVEQSTQAAISATISYLPAIGLALLVLVAGWLAARILRAVSRKALLGTNRLITKLTDRSGSGKAQLTPVVASVLSEVVFWVVILLATAIAARVAELPALSGWLDQIAGWLPNLLIGIAIIVIAYLVSVVAGEQVAASARNARSTQSAMMGRLAQTVIFVTGLIIGLDQIGVNVTLLTALFVVSAGGILIGFSIAFGLGARDHVSNLIGARTARRKLRPGLTVRIGNIEGEVLEVTSTQIAIETVEGRALVPGRMAEERDIFILSPKSEGTDSNG